MSEKRDYADKETETRLHVSPHILDDQHLRALVTCDKVCQTAVTSFPDVEDQVFFSLLEFIPYKDIDKDAVRIVDLPRKQRLQFRLPQDSVEGVVSADPSRTFSDRSAKKSLKRMKISSDLEVDVNVLNKQVEVPKRKTSDNDAQTTLMVSPHVLNEDNVAYVSEEMPIQTIMYTNELGLVDSGLQLQHEPAVSVVDEIIERILDDVMLEATDRNGCCYYVLCSVKKEQLNAIGHCSCASVWLDRESASIYCMCNAHEGNQMQYLPWSESQAQCDKEIETQQQLFLQSVSIQTHHVGCNTIAAQTADFSPVNGTETTAEVKDEGGDIRLAMMNPLYPLQNNFSDNSFMSQLEKDSLVRTPLHDPVTQETMQSKIPVPLCKSKQQLDQNGTPPAQKDCGPSCCKTEAGKKIAKFKIRIDCKQNEDKCAEVKNIVDEKRPEPPKEVKDQCAVLVGCDCSSRKSESPPIKEPFVSVSEQDPDYCEDYFEELKGSVTGVQTELDAVTESVDSFPDAPGGDTCGETTELPWQKFVLPSPRTYVIRSLKKQEPEEPIEEEPVEEEPVCEPNEEGEAEEEPVEEAPPEAEPAEGEREEEEPPPCEPEDPCKDLQPTRLIHEDSNVLKYNEPYMDLMLKLFPDADEICGATTEIPWKDIILPSNVRIRRTKPKPKPDCDKDEVTGICINPECIEDVNVIMKPNVGEAASAPIPVPDSAASQITTASIPSGVPPARCEKACNLCVTLEKPAEEPPKPKTNKCCCSPEQKPVKNETKCSHCAKAEIKPSEIEDCGQTCPNCSQNEEEEQPVCSVCPKCKKADAKRTSSCPNVSSKRSIKANVSFKQLCGDSKVNENISRNSVESSAESKCCCGPTEKISGFKEDAVSAALKAYETEMKPLKAALADLQQKILNLNSPEMKECWCKPPQPSNAVSSTSTICCKGKRVTSTTKLKLNDKSKNNLCECSAEKTRRSLKRPSGNKSQSRLYNPNCENQYDGSKSKKRQDSRPSFQRHSRDSSAYQLDNNASSSYKCPFIELMHSASNKMVDREQRRNSEMNSKGKGSTAENRCSTKVSAPFDDSLFSSRRGIRTEPARSSATMRTKFMAKIK